MPSTSLNHSVTIDVFKSFQLELDSRHDTWEKVVKLSRDVTIESKRLIFHLHRISKELSERSKLLQEAEKKKKLILNKLQQISEILNNDRDPLQFLRAYSAGLQEFIEADSLLYYLTKEPELTCDNIHLGILPLESVKETLTFHRSERNSCVSLSVPVDEYLMGLADVTGEIMRMCINATTGETYDATSKESNNRSTKLCAFNRSLYVFFKAISALPDEHGHGKMSSKYFMQKVTTMANSLLKCEDACYNLKVYGAEIPSALHTPYDEQ